MEASRRPHLPALTSLRFIAAIWIASFHFLWGQGLDWAPRWVRHIAGLGYIALSFFFVLSGFILVYTYAGKSVDLKRFWKARLARLYPVYLFGLVLGAWPFFAGAIQAGAKPWQVAVSAAMTLGMVQAWLPQTALLWNGVGWAVSAEVFCYVLFPPLLRRFTALSPKRRLHLGLGAWALLAAVALAYAIFRPDGSAAFLDYPNYNEDLNWLMVLKFNPISHVPEFMLGMACGFWLLDESGRPRPATSLVAIGSALLILVIALGRHIPYPVLHGGLTAPAFALIVCGLAQRPRWSRFLEFPFLVRLGEASYSLYLLHCFILFIPIQLLAPFSGWKTLADFAVTIAIALLVWRFLEVPAREKIQRLAL